ncbi:class I SAM-dependent methyltransferase [Candidatus Pacearchaeota archaeon]|nr:class I SAM-dependent methyltransferase [Candidatus Pacearchaeota archaeon]
MENQEKVWDAIAQPWQTFRKEPIAEVVEFLRDKKGKVLDLGCGSGRNFIEIKGTIYGVDFSEKMLEYAKKFAEENKINVKLFKSETSNLPFQDDFFDAVVFSAVLQCIPSEEDREKTLKELFRVMKRNSECWISVWDKNQERFKDSDKESLIPWNYEGKEYMRYYYLYETDEIVELLKKMGFIIVSVNNSTNPNGFYSKNNIDIVVRKP